MDATTAIKRLEVYVDMLTEALQEAPAERWSEFDGAVGALRFLCSEFGYESKVLKEIDNGHDIEAYDESFLPF